MNIQFFENENGVSFNLKPETIEEVAALARIANNTKAEKPDINFYFSSSPQMVVWIKKINKSLQKNNISNDKK